MRTLERRREKHWRRRNRRANRKAKLTGYQRFYLNYHKKGLPSTYIDYSWSSQEMILRELMRKLDHNIRMAGLVHRNYELECSGAAIGTVIQIRRPR